MNDFKRVAPQVNASERLHHSDLLMHTGGRRHRGRRSNVPLAHAAGAVDSSPAVEDYSTGGGGYAVVRLMVSRPETIRFAEPPPGAPVS